MRKVWISLKKPRIRLRQGYGVTGYADVADGGAHPASLFAGRGRPGSIDVHPRRRLETACPQAVSIYEMRSSRQTKAGAVSFLQADFFQ